MGESKLRKLKMKVASNKEVLDWAAKNNQNMELKSSQVCAGAGEGKDACKVYENVIFPKKMKSFKMTL